MVQLTFNPDSANAWVATLKEGENTLGRADDNDIRVDEGGVSGHHCRISVNHGSVTITDLNSTNGTHFNGSRIDQAAWPSGHTLYLGHLPVRLDAPVVHAPVAAPAVAVAAAAAAGPAPVVRLRIAGHSASSAHASPPPLAGAGDGAPPVEAPPARPAFVTAPAGTHCKSHSRSPASWTCPKCHRYLCDLCVATRASSAGPAHMCRGCGVECIPVHVEFVASGGERGFFARLPGAFVFPFRGAGFLVLIVATLIFAALSAVSGLFSILLTMAATGYLFLFLQNIIHGAAVGEETMPSLPEFDGLFSAFFTLIGTVFVSFILPIGLGIAKLCDVEIPMSALIASIFASLLYFPMAFLAVAMLDSVAAANPLLVIPSILKVPVHYLVTVILLCGVFGVRLLGDIASSAAADVTYTTTDMSVLFGAMGVRAIWSFISIYLLTVAMRILGLLYVTQKEKLGWL